MLNEKITAVINLVGGDIENINITNEDIIEIDGAEYRVLTEEEADDAFQDYQESLWDDMGIQAFSDWARNYILENFVDEDWFAEALKEMQQNYIDDIKYEEGRLEEEMEDAGVEDEEEFLDYLVKNSGDPVQYYIDNFGMEDFSKLAVEQNLINVDEVIQWTKEQDGRGGALASYDGEENEIDGYYIYRTN